MKKLSVPFIFLLLLTITSCSENTDLSSADISKYDQDFTAWVTDGVPVWLDKSFGELYDTEEDVTSKYLLASTISVFIEGKIAKVHEIGSRKFISISHAFGFDRRNLLIDSNIEPDNDILVYEDSSTNITTLGRYDILSGCFTPGGKKITDQKLCKLILSSPGQVIYCYQNGRNAIQNDRVYGLNDIKEWLKPNFENELRKMCEKRFSEHGDRFFWGAVCQNYYHNNAGYKRITEEHTNGRGTPFVIETYVTNDGSTLTKYVESFIATEDGTITPFPFDEIMEIVNQYGDDEVYNPLFQLTPII